MKPSGLLLGISADAPHAGKSTFAAAFAALHLLRLKEAVPVSETSDEARLLFDAAFGTRTYDDEEEKRRFRGRLGAFVAAESERTPGFLVRPLLELPRPRLISGIRGLDEVAAVRAAGGAMVRITTTEATRRARMGPEQYAAFTVSPRDTRWTALGVGSS